MNAGRSSNVPMRTPPRIANRTQSVEDKQTALEKASDWATQPAVQDAKSAGVIVEPEKVDDADADLELGLAIGLKKPKREKKAVTHLLKIPEDLNERLESVLDKIPRTSKQKFIMAALEEMVSGIERRIATYQKKKLVPPN